MSEKRCCENCGNLRCANSIVAYWWNECVDTDFEAHWMPKPTNADRIRSAQDNEIARELLAMYLHGHCDCNEENGICVTEQSLIDWPRQPSVTEEGEG